MNFVDIQLRWDPQKIPAILHDEIIRFLVVAGSDRPRDRAGGEWIQSCLGSGQVGTLLQLPFNMPRGRVWSSVVVGNYQFLTGLDGIIYIVVWPTIREKDIPAAESHSELRFSLQAYFDPKQDDTRVLTFGEAHAGSPEMQQIIQHDEWAPEPQPRLKPGDVL